MSHRINSLTITCVQKIYNYSYDIFIVFQLCIPIKYMYIFILILYYKDIKLIFLFINRFFILNITTNIAFKVSYDTVFLTWRGLYIKICVISVCVCVCVCVCARAHVRAWEYHPHANNTTDYILLHIWYSYHYYITYKIASDLQATQACQMETL